MRATIPLAVGGLVLTACVFLAPSPSPKAVVRLEGSGTLPVHLSIYDRINIIERATPAEGIVLDDDKLNVRSEAEDAEAMLVSWIGSGCETAPTLTIDSGANGNSLALILNRGPVRDGAVCGDMGIAYGLHLELSRPVDVSAIETQILTGSH